MNSLQDELRQRGMTLGHRMARNAPTPAHLAQAIASCYDVVHAHPDGNDFPYYAAGVVAGVVRESRLRNGPYTWLADAAQRYGTP